MYLYIYIYIYAHVCIYAYIHIRISIYIHVCILTYTFVYTPISIYIYIHGSRKGKGSCKYSVAKSYRCLIFTGQFQQYQPTISGSFAHRDMQCKASYASSPFLKQSDDRRGKCTIWEGGTWRIYWHGKEENIIHAHMTSMYMYIYMYFHSCIYVCIQLYMYLYLFLCRHIMCLLEHTYIIYTCIYIYANTIS